MPTRRNRPKQENFNRKANLPFQLRLKDFEIAMQDVYDLFYDVNTGLLEKGLERFDDFLRPAIMSGLLSDLLTASVAKHSRTLTQITYFNGRIIYSLNSSTGRAHCHSERSRGISQSILR
jgi:hypothetical protein